MSNPNSHPPPPPTTTLNPSEYTTTLTTTAITTILRSLGFKSSKTSALQTLTRITTLFLHSLSSSAAANATANHRTHPNFFDFISALELISLPFGFPGASDINQPLLNSNTIESLRYFLDDLRNHLRRRIKLSPPLQPMPDVFFCGGGGGRGGELLPFTEIIKENDENIGKGGKECFRHRHRHLQLPSPPQPSPEKIGSGGGSGGVGGGGRGCEVPIWLPPFPEIIIKENDENKAKGGKECLWEHNYNNEMGRALVRAEKSKEKGGKDCFETGRAWVRAEKGKEKGIRENVMMLGRRQRVKFKFIRRRKSLNLSEFNDDLALRNGVCRGGKRVCLIKKVDDITRFFQFDDDHDH